MNNTTLKQHNSRNCVDVYSVPERIATS